MSQQQPNDGQPPLVQPPPQSYDRLPQQQYNQQWQQPYIQSPSNTYYPPEQWQTPPMMPPPPPPNKKPDHTQRNAWLIIGAVVLACMFIGIIASANQSTQPTTTTTTQVTQPASTGQQPTPTTKTYAQFGDGMFQVGKDIQPGTYRTRVGSPGCYYARLSAFDTQAIISNDDTDAVAIITIAATDKAFESRNCGMWTKDLSAITTSKTSFGDGILIVGTDIKPGTYKNSGSSGCYYARLSAFDTQAIISNDNTDAVAIITIAATDKAFESRNCGMWTKQ